MDATGAAARLSQDDQLSLAIGCLVRRHADLEYKLRNVFQALVDYEAPSERGASVSGTERLAAACLARLGRAGVDDGLTTAGTASIDAAREANARRNRIVHDLLLVASAEDGEPMQWTSFHGTPGHRDTIARPVLLDVQMVQEVHQALKRAAVRVSGLFMALHAVLPRLRDRSRPGEGESGLPIYVELMADRFNLLPDGGWELAPKLQT